MYKPDYNGKSIVNLMSSFSDYLEVDSLYSELNLLKGKDLKKYDNIVFLVLDGLGYKWMKEKKKDSFLDKNCLGKMTSVFPTTTAAAISTFYTGVAPQQHAFTGWDMWFKELGSIVRPLLFSTQIGKVQLSGILNSADIFNTPSLYSKSTYNTNIILNTEYMKSAYNNMLCHGSNVFLYKNLDEYFLQIKKSVTTTGKNFTYAYRPEFDTKEHKFGSKSKKVSDHFDLLEKGIKKLLADVKGTKTLIVVTADHGQIDVNNDEKIFVHEHPEFYDTLTIPVLNKRVCYCYVRPHKQKKFEEYVKDKFSHCCEIYPSYKLIEKNYFGIGDVNPKLHDRVGDYILIMKENYVMMQKEFDKKYPTEIGFHGGTSEDEMFVPLIILE